MVCDIFYWCYKFFVFVNLFLLLFFYETVVDLFLFYKCIFIGFESLFVLFLLTVIVFYWYRLLNRRVLREI